MNINDITITSIETITAFDIGTGNFRFVMDELQNATIAQSQETTDITGKGGRKLSTLKKNKAVTISGTNGLISGGLLELQTGGTFDKKTTSVLWTDNLVVPTQRLLHTRLLALLAPKSRTFMLRTRTVLLVRSSSRTLLLPQVSSLMTPVLRLLLSLV